MAGLRVLLPLSEEGAFFLSFFSLSSFFSLFFVRETPTNPSPGASITQLTPNHFLEGPCRALHFENTDSNVLYLKSKKGSRHIT